MGVEHEAPILPQGPLIFSGLARLNVGLRETAHAVHSIGQINSMPMNRGGNRQPVGHVDPYSFALDGLDRGAVHAPIVTPAFRSQPGVKSVIDLFGNQVKDFHAIHDLKR